MLALSVKKYVFTLLQLLQAKGEYEKMGDKIEELSEKNAVVNGEVARMANEHEELSIKFDNLQSSLEFISSENESIFRKEVNFLKEQESTLVKMKNINDVLGVYRGKYDLCKKIQQQNKNIKTRYA